MRRLFFILFAGSFLTACNSGNEGSDSIYDTTRKADSTKLVDSLLFEDSSIIDNTQNRLDNKDTSQPATGN